jgi:hypothetical protein
MASSAVVFWQLVAMLLGIHALDPINPHVTGMATKVTPIT